MPLDDAGPVPPISAEEAKNGHLEGFQLSLLARMEAADIASFRARRLAVLIGTQTCLIELAEAGEIVPLASLPAMTHVPLTQPWYLGLVSIRGNLVGVADLAGFSGAALQPVDQANRIIVFSPLLSSNCGLLVSRVLGLRDVSSMREIPSDAWQETSLPGIHRRYRDDEEVEWLEISLASLLTHPSFLHIGR